MPSPEKLPALAPAPAPVPVEIIAPTPPGGLLLPLCNHLRMSHCVHLPAVLKALTVFIYFYQLCSSNSSSQGSHSVHLQAQGSCIFRAAGRFLTSVRVLQMY